MIIAALSKIAKALCLICMGAAAAIVGFIAFIFIFNIVFFFYCWNVAELTVHLIREL